MLGVVHIVARKLRTCISCSLNPRESESENTNKPKISCFLGTIWQAEQTEVETKQLVPNMKEGGLRERLS